MSYTTTNMALGVTEDTYRQQACLSCTFQSLPLNHSFLGYTYCGICTVELSRVSTVTKYWPTELTIITSLWSQREQRVLEFIMHTNWQCNQQDVNTMSYNTTDKPWCHRRCKQAPQQLQGGETGWRDREKQYKLQHWWGSHCVFM